MKPRNGFVSNSSSSSFILFVTENTWSCPTEEYIKDKNFYAYNAYREYNEGYDLFKFTPEMAKAVLDYEVDMSGWIFYDVAYLSKTNVFEKDKMLEIIKKIKDEKFVIVNCDVSDHSIGNFEDFIDRYCY
jgi:hypothetical protein